MDLGETKTTTDAEERDSDWTYEGNRSPSLAFVLAEAIAEHQGTDPLDPDFSLYESIDTDLLDSLLVSASGTELFTEFRISDVVVSVRKSTDDEVSIDVSDCET